MWIKSSYCPEKDLACVEVSNSPDVVAIRDSKNPDMPHIHLDRADFEDLLVKIKEL